MNAVYWIAVGALTLPLALIAVTSLASGQVVGFPIGAPTLRWYATALEDPALRSAFLLSVVLALGSALGALLAGTWIALAFRLVRPAWMRFALTAMALAPLVIPGIVHAIALRIAMQAVALDPGPAAVLLGHVTHSTPYAVIMVMARRATLPAELIDAARDLGAGPVRCFCFVVIPWLVPALLGAGMLAALTSFDDFIRSFFLGGYDPTLPVLIFGRLRSGLTPAINAAATLVLLAACTAGIAADRAMRSRAVMTAME